MLSVSCALVDLAVVSEFWRTKYLIWHFFLRECCCKCEIQSNDVAKKEQFTICTTIWSTINDPWISCQYTITMSSLTWLPTSQSVDSEWAHEKLIERIFSNWIFRITIRFKNIWSDFIRKVDHNVMESLLPLSRIVEISWWWLCKWPPNSIW